MNQVLDLQKLLNNDQRVYRPTVMTRTYWSTETTRTIRDK
ncbi:hypothetical protein SAMN05421737_109126 [Shouchella lonarensis]|uniref:Uncharacterized protein n=1 Tax=Shouchella lonarensis TaxID=1464122 RepID=A0A1G6M8M2_9BACI|nr:hypothetical protein SAMN05421737_109126 [Shouchella lonarensis]